MLQNIVTALKSINKVTGDLRIAIGSPKHAGLYQAFAVAVNKNYNTGVGTGTVIVAMNAAGMKLEPNTELKKQTITVSEAEKYKRVKRLLQHLPATAMQATLIRVASTTASPVLARSTPATTSRLHPVSTS